MYNRRSVRKLQNKEGRKITEKSKNWEGNSNITSKRLTIPPGFLCLGVKSEVKRKDEEREKYDFNKQRKSVLSEDLHSLFLDCNNENNRNLRRSARLSAKRSKSRQNLTAAEYYTEIISVEEPQKFVLNEKSSDKHKRPILVKDNSKSLFHRINSQSQPINSQKHENLNAEINLINNSSSQRVPNFDLYKTFCVNLKQQISVHFKRNVLLDSYQKIVVDISEINTKISGGMYRTNSSKKFKLSKSDVDEIVNNFIPIPKSDWVYKTPPKQQNSQPVKAKECPIQPAVIYSNKEQCSIFEVNPILDLTKCSQNQKVELDGRFLRHVSTINKTPYCFGKENNQNHVNFEGGSRINVDNQSFCEGTFRNNVISQKVNEDDNNMVGFLRPLPPENMEILTGRPTKQRPPPQNPSRFFHIKKRLDMDCILSDGFLPEESGCSHYLQNHKQSDVTFIEDDGEFKMVQSQNDEQSQNFQFDFNIKQFDTSGMTDGKLFRFKSDKEHNMFDFSHLKRN